MKKLGIIPARMAASRFPGKPLHPIMGRPMIEHVYLRAAMFQDWDELLLATCDNEISDYASTNNIPTVMTSNSHTRALDRVAEAAAVCDLTLSENDIVVCVQGDEPMMHPDMIDAVIKPLIEDETVYSTVLAMEIVSEDIFSNPDTVKIVHDLNGDVTYTSRAAVPYCKSFPPNNYIPRRIYGIFGFRWHFLQKFTQTPESPLELAEACDSNRIFDNGFRQRIAPYPNRPSFSVDSKADITLVEAAMEQDEFWGKY